VARHHIKYTTLCMEGLRQAAHTCLMTDRGRGSTAQVLPKHPFPTHTQNLLFGWLAHKVLPALCAPHLGAVYPAPSY
jgi:hypothetical protein